MDTAPSSSGPPDFLHQSPISPNAIPPRTSSTGYTLAGVPPTKAVLRPLVAESDWLSRPQSDYLSDVRRGRCRRHSSFASTIIMHGPPAPDPSRYATEDFNFAARKTWTDEKEKIIRGPYDYLVKQHGKDFRSQLIASFNSWLEVPQESLKVITSVVGMLHTASLLIDDVEDNSELRRGSPVAHVIYGMPQTVNSANYFYFLALHEIQKLQNAQAVTIYTDELVHLHRGQGMDLYWRDNLKCPTEDEYLEMVGNKTGGLFRLGVKLMQAESRSQSVTDCVELVNLMGLIYQIRDDYMNLNSSEMTLNKGMCEDLTEGKFSFPIIHSIRSDPVNSQLLNILKQKTTSEDIKRYAVKYMEKTGSFEYTRKVLHVLIQRARLAAEDIDAGRGLCGGIQRILDRMASL